MSELERRSVAVADDLLDDDQFDREWDAYERRDPWAARGDRAGQPPSPLGRNKRWRGAARFAEEYRAAADRSRGEARGYLARLIRGDDPFGNVKYGFRSAMGRAAEYSRLAAGLALAVDGWW